MGGRATQDFLSHRKCKRLLYTVPGVLPLAHDSPKLVIASPSMQVMVALRPGGTRVGAQHQRPPTLRTPPFWLGGRLMPHPRASRGSGSGAGPAVSHQPDTSLREALGATLGAPGHADGHGLVGPSTATALPWGCPCHPRTSRDLRRGRAPRRSRPCGQRQGCPADPAEAQAAGLRVFTLVGPPGGQPGPLLPQCPWAPDGEWGSRPCSETMAQTPDP